MPASLIGIEVIHIYGHIANLAHKIKYSPVLSDWYKKCDDLAITRKENQFGNKPSNHLQNKISLVDEA